MTSPDLYILISFFDFLFFRAPQKFLDDETKKLKRPRPTGKDAQTPNWKQHDELLVNGKMWKVSVKTCLEWPSDRGVLQSRACVLVGEIEGAKPVPFGVFRRFPDTLVTSCYSDKEDIILPLAQLVSSFFFDNSCCNLDMRS